MNKIPDEIIIQVTRNKSPIEGVVLFLEFMTLRKNKHIVISPATNSKGIVTINKPLIDFYVQEDCKLFCMDYCGLNNNFTGTIKVVIPDYLRIAKAQKAYEDFNLC